MTDSSSFTSLFALVDSHLSKCTVEDGNSPAPGRIHSISIPSLNGVQKGLSDTRITSPCQRIPIPSLSLNESPITSVLSVQLTNMFKAQELKKQQELEKERLQEEMRKLKLEEDSCVIDLMQAVQKPGQLPPKPNKEVLSSSSSFESLLFDHSDFIIGSQKKISETKIKPDEPLLPCTTDLSYILQQEIKTGKCSAFGKVLTSRLRPVAAPYLREVVKSDLVRFDFKTKSPCDLIKEKLRKPTSYPVNTVAMDIFNQIMQS